MLIPFFHSAVPALASGHERVQERVRIPEPQRGCGVAPRTTFCRPSQAEQMEASKNPPEPDDAFRRTFCSISSSRRERRITGEEEEETETPRPTAGPRASRRDDLVPARVRLLGGNEVLVTTNDCIYPLDTVILSPAWYLDFR